MNASKVIDIDKSGQVGGSVTEIVQYNTIINLLTEIVTKGAINPGKAYFGDGTRLAVNTDPHEIPKGQ
eukprot:10441397-Ditylum_brightwellii.AAC.1